MSTKRIMYFHSCGVQFKLSKSGGAELSVLYSKRKYSASEILCSLCTLFIEGIYVGSETYFTQERK